MIVRVAILVLCVAVQGRGSPMATTYDTIIVGLGPAGCTAASTLAQAGKKILALEAQNRIGGRVKTVPFGDGVIELGAEWIHGTHPSRVYDLAIKNNVSIISQNLGFEAYRSNGTKADTALINELFEYTLEVQEHPPETPQPLGQFITTKIKEYLGEKHPDVLKDKDYVDEILHFLDLLVDNYEASNSWNDVTTQTHYVDLEGDQHMSWHRNGYSTLFDILLNTYKGGPGYPNLEIQLNKEVVLIEWPTDPEQLVTVSCKDGTKYTANNVIVTVSLGVLKERHSALFTPTLPQTKVTAINKIAMGLIGKAVFHFDVKWWRADREAFYLFWLKGDGLSKNETDDWTTDIVGYTVPKGCEKCLTFWMKYDTAMMVEKLPEDVVKSKIMEILRKFLGKHFTIPEPVAMIRSDWHSNPFTRGSYTYDNVDAPKYPDARIHLGEPLLDSAGKPRVLFAGEATDPTHFSTVHGATDTGYREAMRLLPATSKI
ncbi:probable polyamine oxidase 5 isoform X2 [Bombyx mandarina]|uniref:Probable polyamine oxidase 5 isoform X2 n=1 Tax=Bombyx mandarina TaxID=7092 RepID=A0A6J2K7T6_BOMMA|nr:probable polyamine oxidase 5 isoform X2 [Bombyx mandarina]